MKEKFNFKPGDKIFAKVKGFVYWPARVNPIPKDILIPPNKIPIFFFGTHEVYFISPSSCWPYDNNKSKWGKPHSRAHFNEGMDEIENNPTLFQYGADPNAENYLAQFYEFKRSDGEMSSSNLKGKDNVDSISLDPKKQSSKKRNTSGSSFSTKENKDLNSNKSSKKSVENIAISDKLEKKLLLKEVEAVVSNDKVTDIEKIEINTGDENVDTDIHSNSDSVESQKNISEQSKDGEHMPKLRSRSLSSSKKTMKRKLVKTEKSEDGSDSVSVNSDNPEDEDFQPAKKSTKISKNSKAKVSILKKKENTKSERKPKSEKKRNIVRNPKSTKKVANVSKNRKENKNIVSDVDSLSSISSLDDWQEKDEKRRKEHEEMVKQANMEELLKEEKAIKEASKQARKKSRSKSNIIDDEQKNVTTIVNDVSKNELKDEISSNLINTVDCKIEGAEISQMMSKDVSLEVSNSDVIKSSIELNDKISNILVESNIKEDIVDIPCDKLDTPIEYREKLTKTDYCENLITDDAEEVSNFESKKSRKSSNKKFENKVQKNEKSTPKKHISSRKRRIVQSDESDEEVVDKNNKKSRITRLAQNDSEDDDKIMHTSLEDDLAAVDASEDISYTKPIVDKIKALQSYNCDIRSSLVLGHEDYDKCIERFQGLCTMDIDLISLVTVWQLMDTVKKCRRYKRDERVKNEAQNVYKRFLEIYSQSSPDELQRSQSLLAQYRSNQNSGSKTSASMNGHSSQNQSMPTSVDDMFHQSKQQSVDKVVVAAVAPMVVVEAVEEMVKEASPPPVVEFVSQPVSSVVLDEEKMRLLSADLEAKVSDILNKIEKNSSVSNPINRQSMSHLLPARTDDNVIQLPVEWGSVDNRGGGGRQSRDSDDDEDEDVEAIVKKIEDVPIKDEEEEDDYNDGNRKVPPPGVTELTTETDGGSGASALDARIENLFNTSFVGVGGGGTNSSINKDTTTGSGEQAKTAHKRVPVVTTKTRIPGLSVSPTPPSSDKTSPPSQVINIINDEFEHESLDTAADSDIYDLLGV